MFRTWKMVGQNLQLAGQNTQWKMFRTQSKNVLAGQHTHNGKCLEHGKCMVRTYNWQDSTHNGKCLEHGKWKVRTYNWYWDKTRIGKCLEHTVKILRKWKMEGQNIQLAGQNTQWKMFKAHSGKCDGWI